MGVGLPKFQNFRAFLHMERQSKMRKRMSRRLLYALSLIVRSRKPENRRNQFAFVSKCPSTKASRVYAALLRIGWNPKPKKGSSHVQLERPGFRDYTWAFHDSDELGNTMLKKIAKYTGLTPEDL